MVGPPPPRNRIVDKTFINIMLEYSAKKNKAKGPPAYSTLNPDTSSDSPSVKSKGVRFVSAKVETNQMKAIGVQDNRNQERFCASVIDVRLNVPASITTHKTINPKLTS